MKYIASTVILLFIFSCSESQPLKELPQESNLVEILMSDSINKLIGMPISEIERMLGENHRQISYYSEPPCYLRGIYLEYSDSLYVLLYLNELELQNTFVPGCKWDNHLLFQEKIAAIEVYLNNKKIKSHFVKD